MVRRDANNAASKGRRARQELISQRALIKILHVKSAFFPSIAGLRQPGGYPRSALALIVEKCEDYRNPWRRTHTTLAELARMAGIRTGALDMMFARHGVVEDVHAGKGGRRFENARLPALLEFIDQHRYRHPQFISASELANHLGVSTTALSNSMKNDIMVPDRMNAVGVYQFRRDRLQELEERWKNRLHAYPAWAPVRGVITQYGMMLPRVVPRGEVFTREILSQPGKPMRDLFRPKPTFYNLSDLSGSPSETPSKTIFASTSLKHVRTRVGSKSRRRTS